MAPRAGGSPRSADSANGATRSSSAPAKVEAVELESALVQVISQRLREYRIQLGLTVTQLATESGLSKGMLSKIENGQASTSLLTLSRLAAALNIPLTAFFRGLDEERDVFLVKAGQGMDIAHRNAKVGHRYQLLGSMRGPQKRMEPTLVTLMERTEVFPLYQHPGTEFLLMLTGQMEYGVGAGVHLLEPGDSLQFEGEVPHGPKSLLQLPVQFLAVKAFGGVVT
ncbi:MAG: XRE family transcriptional regulator [Actinomycetes bacterium]